jgi:thymidylate synthase (FAD)
MPRQIPYDSRKLMCDSSVVQAARVSYGQGLKNYETDKKLINYLYKNKHTSPFEMIKFKFHVKAPIFVARQWFRHRMSNYNEISGRYTELKEDFYIPEKVSSQSKINKQLSEDDNLLENIQIIRQNDYLKNYLKN